MADLKAPGALLLIAAAFAVIALSLGGEARESLMGVGAVLAVIGLVLGAVALVKSN